MLRGIWQLTKQSLAIDSRRVGLHAIRFGLAIVLYVAVCYAHRSQGLTATGLSLFKAQLIITEFFLSATAIFGFSQTITEEKEEETLGLIRLADISPLAIILGKIAGLLCDAALLIAIQYPFTIVAITLGGVSWPQVMAGYLALFTYLWLLATVGLMASVLQPTGGLAARLTAMFVVVYAIPPFISISAVSGWVSLYRFYQPISLPIRLLEVTESSFDSSPWCWPVAIAGLTGLICLIVSCLAFDHVALAEPKTDVSNSVAVGRRLASRPWSRPIVWREYMFVTGGPLWTVARIVVQVGIMGAMFLAFQQPQSVGFALAWSAMCSGLLGLLDGTWSASRLFRDEIRYRTWSSLVQTPHSLERLAFEKTCGWCLGLLPCIVAPYLFIIAMVIWHEHVRDWHSRIEILVGSTTIGVSIFGYLHLLVLTSLYFGWKGTPLTLTLCIAAGWLYLVSVFRLGLSFESRSACFVLTGLLICGIMFVLQQLILRRLEHLAETA